MQTFLGTNSPSAQPKMNSLSHVSQGKMLSPANQNQFAPEWMMYLPNWQTMKPLILIVRFIYFFWHHVNWLNSRNIVRLKDNYFHANKQTGRQHTERARSYDAPQLINKQLVEVTHQWRAHPPRHKAKCWGNTLLATTPQQARRDGPTQTQVACWQWVHLDSLICSPRI